MDQNTRRKSTVRHFWSGVTTPLMRLGTMKYTGTPLHAAPRELLEEALVYCRLRSAAFAARNPNKRNRKGVSYYGRWAGHIEQAILKQEAIL